MAKAAKAPRGRRKVWLFFGIGSVVLLLGTAIILPRFRSMISASQQGTNRGHWGMLMSAISIYYGDHEGIWPPRLDDPEFMAKYLTNGVPTIHLAHRGHQPSNAVESYPFTGTNGKVDLSKLRDTGHWLYEAATGTLVLDCTHRSDTGLPYYQTGYEPS